MKKVLLALVLIVCLTGCGTVKISEAEKQKYDGGWYGWIYVAEATGAYESINNMSWDVCGEFTYATESVDGKETEVAKAKFWIYDDTSSEVLRFGTMLKDDDSWSAFEPYAFDEASNYISHEFITEYSGLLSITFRVENENGTFNGLLSVKKWGEKWDDVMQSKPENVPYYYNDWYLPLIKDGKEMPK